MAQAVKLTAAQSKAYNFAQGWLARGQTATAGYTAYESIGGAIRRQDWFGLTRYIGGVKEAGYNVQNIPHKYYPNYNRLPDSLTDIRRNYSFDVRIGTRGELDENGKLKYEYVTVTTDRQLTVQEILDEAESYIEESPEEYEMQHVEPVVEKARKRGV